MPSANAMKTRGAVREIELVDLGRRLSEALAPGTARGTPFAHSEPVRAGVRRAAYRTIDGKEAVESVAMP